LRWKRNGEGCKAKRSIDQAVHEHGEESVEDEEQKQARFSSDQHVEAMEERSWGFPQDLDPYLSCSECRSAL